MSRKLETGDALCAALFYDANEDAQEDRRVAKLAHQAGALVNIVDNLQDSQFITPAIVDRDPVTVAIGTEGAAPVLARGRPVLAPYVDNGNVLAIDLEEAGAF